MKKILSFLFFLIVILAAAGAAAYAARATLLAKGMEIALGVPVAVEKFDINPGTGEVGIYGLQIDNPAGFTQKKLATLPEIYVKINVPALTKEKKVHVELVRVNIESVTVERSKGMTYNLKELKPMKESSAKKDAQKQAEAKQKGEAPKVQIDDVRLSIGRVRFVDPTLPSQDFNLNIKDQGMPKVESFAEGVREIIRLIISKAGLGRLVPDLNNLVPNFSGVAGQFRDTALDSVGNVKGLAGDATGTLTGTASTLKDEASETASALKEEVSGAIKKLKF